MPGLFEKRALTSSSISEYQPGLPLRDREGPYYKLGYAAVTADNLSVVIAECEKKLMWSVGRSEIYEETIVL